MTPMQEVEGKVAFITGGASGIGFGIARSLLDAGMKVAIGDNNQEHLDAAIERTDEGGHRFHAIRVDITDRAAMQDAAAEVVATFGKLHVLVNNAGVQNPVSLSRMSYDEWDKIMEVNVGGIFNGVRAFLPHIRKHGEGGHILTTASMIGLFTLGEHYAAYCASKFATVAMMEALRAELAPSNIGVSILCPGPVRTNLEEILKDLPLAADPMDIGRLALRGMRNNDLYILTHPEFNSLIKCRNEAILAAAPSDAQPSAEREALAQLALERSIYVIELNRRCDGLPDPVNVSGVA